MAISIVYEDAQILCALKPSDLLCHKISNYSEESNLAELLETQLGQRLYLLHRLDRKTSGLCLFAKNASSASFYGQAFREGNIKKVYLAQLSQRPLLDKGCISQRVGKALDTPIRSKMAVTKDGKPALTRFQTLDSSQKPMALLLPFTGRRHQLRVHMAHIACPIFNDPLYHLGDAHYLSLIKSASRTAPMHLHALFLSIPVQNQSKNIQIYSPLPEFAKDLDFNQLKSQCFQNLR